MKILDITFSTVLITCKRSSRLWDREDFQNYYRFNNDIDIVDLWSGENKILEIINEGLLKINTIKKPYRIISIAHLKPGAFFNDIVFDTDDEILALLQTRSESQINNHKRSTLSSLTDKQQVQSYWDDQKAVHQVFIKDQLKNLFSTK